MGHVVVPPHVEGNPSDQDEPPHGGYHPQWHPRLVTPRGLERKGMACRGWSPGYANRSGVFRPSPKTSERGRNRGWCGRSSLKSTINSLNHGLALAIESLFSRAEGIVELCLASVNCTLELSDAG
jgi:hypothetical protein